ncbi:MAG TPA: iron-sulfur protein [Pseudonocardiaceae bacterium]|nr:iron-sulfur protein [Pseudonocardiaceae bacterium]
MPQAVVPAEPPEAAAGPCTAHPLATSVSAADRAVGWMSFRLLDTTSTAGDHWNACDEALADPTCFTQWRATLAQQLAQQHAHVPEQTTAAHVLKRYLGIPTHLGATLFHSARRVPSLHPRQLAFRLDLAWVQEVGLRPGRFWCLPDDPDAGHPDATPVADEVALAAVLRSQVVAHAALFLKVYGPLVRFGRRTLWAAVTDTLDVSLLVAGRSFGSTQAGAADARLVLAEREEPLTSASTVCEVTDERGRAHWIRRRGWCCFTYALPGVEHPCASCPRVSDAERIRILGTLDPN